MKAHIIGWGAWHRPRSMVYGPAGHGFDHGRSGAKRGVTEDEENRPMGARHALDTPQGPHAVRSASSRFASHAKVEAAASKTAGCRPSVAGTLLTEESGYDLR